MTITFDGKGRPISAYASIDHAAYPVPPIEPPVQPAGVTGGLTLEKRAELRELAEAEVAREYGWTPEERDAYYSKLPGDERLVAGLDPLPEHRTAPPDPVERCPDCLRPKWIPSGDNHGDRCDAHMPHVLIATRCKDLTIARLRSDLASARALSEAERAVLEGVLKLRAHARSGGASDELIGAWESMVDDLIALRAKEKPDAL